MFDLDVVSICEWVTYDGLINAWGSCIWYLVVRSGGGGYVTYDAVDGH